MNFSEKVKLAASHLFVAEMAAKFKEEGKTKDYFIEEFNRIYKEKIMIGAFTQAGNYYDMDAEALNYKMLMLKSELDRTDGTCVRLNKSTNKFGTEEFPDITPKEIVALIKTHKLNEIAQKKQQQLDELVKDLLIHINFHEINAKVAALPTIGSISVAIAIMYPTLPESDEYAQPIDSILRTSGVGEYGVPQDGRLPAVLSSGDSGFHDGSHEYEYDSIPETDPVAIAKARANMKAELEEEEEEEIYAEANRGELNNFTHKPNPDKAPPRPIGDGSRGRPSVDPFDSAEARINAALAKMKEDNLKSRTAKAKAKMPLASDGRDARRNPQALLTQSAQAAQVARAGRKAPPEKAPTRTTRPKNP